MQYTRYKNYDSQTYFQNIMGPNPLKLLEELMTIHPLPHGLTVLDLGCGRGVTSAFLAQEYGHYVFAADIWIDPTENRQFFDTLGLSSRQIIPLRAEAHELPFAQEFFDAVVSIDSYHYFGLGKSYLNTHLLPLVKKGGYILIVVPGFKRDIHDNIPPEMLLSWRPEDLDTLHDAAHWREILNATQDAQILHIGEMEGCDECWNDWLSSDNEYAVNDRAAMRAGAARHMSMIAIVIRRD